ncbi:helix-turn-helix domain-containing protein [Ruegeria litorea]|uniref:Helix-turn-helix domain-containing protein n=1 Tax=Falsiruegeria litorea TaxID=1280831 RepID=A0ABS5WQE3_9RHOB|nr:helix-turn-helix domain-containing protein [Falsiruegeria litorea]MBT3141365.1 helix-turn-helix domain-containing protein [Falsiruegeria litorea]
MNLNVTLQGGDCPRLFTLSGRIGQTMHHLMQAKQQGITSLENPAIRLAAHIHSLREMGFVIDTETEPHGGAYPGYHARYRLRSSVALGHNQGEGKQ